MKLKILIVSILFSILGVAGCGPECSSVCFSDAAEGTGFCLATVVHYKYTWNDTVRSATVDAGGCFFPDAVTVNKVRKCPLASEVIEVGEPFTFNPCTGEGFDFAFPLQWDCQDPVLGHVIGRHDGVDGWSATVGWDPAGYLQYGPYTPAVPVGDNTAVWGLAIDNNTNDNLAIVTLDVNDATTQEQLAVTQVNRRDWTSTNTYQYFTLPFKLDSYRAHHQLEFRCYWHGYAYVKEQGCGFVNMQWNSIDWSLGHVVGRSDWDYWSDFDAWSTYPSDGPGYLQYGPYTQYVPTGNNVALWNLLIDNNTADNNDMVILDINDATTQTVLATQEVSRGAFKSPNYYQTFALPFTVDSSRAGHQFEFRAYSMGQAYINQQSVGVIQPSQ